MSRMVATAMTPADREAAASREALALHRKAWEIVRRVRLAGGDFQELTSAGWQLEKRRQLLLRQLGSLDPDTGDLLFARPTEGRPFSVRFGDPEE